MESRPPPPLSWLQYPTTHLNPTVSPAAVELARLAALTEQHQQCSLGFHAGGLATTTNPVHRYQARQAILKMGFCRGRLYSFFQKFGTEIKDICVLGLQSVPEHHA